MNKLEDIRIKFKKDVIINNFIQAYDEMDSNLMYGEIIDVLKLIQDDMKNKKDIMLSHLKNIFPERNWEEEIDSILKNKMLG